jgi:hypothetical protein
MVHRDDLVVTGHHALAEETKVREDAHAG